MMRDELDDLKGVLRRLKDELERREDLDGEATQLLRDLDTDIHALLSTRTAPAVPEGLLARAEALEARFAAKHPGLEGIVREIVDALARMGI